jgi:hypothetical protein
MSDGEQCEGIGENWHVKHEWPWPYRVWQRFDTAVGSLSCHKELGCLDCRLRILLGTQRNESVGRAYGVTRSLRPLTPSTINVLLTKNVGHGTYYYLMNFRITERAVPHSSKECPENRVEQAIAPSHGERSVGMLLGGEEP